MLFRFMTSIVFFDLDHTLIKGTSAEMLFIRWLFWHGKIGIRVLFRVFVFFITHFRDVQGTAIRGNKMYLKGMRRDDLLRYTQEIFRSSIERRISNTGREELFRLIQEGKHIVLLSASIDVLAEYISRFLGIEACISSQLEFNNGICTGKILSHPYGKRKLELALRYAQEHEVSLYDSWAYANATSDIFLLLAVGTHVAVNPSRALLLLARRRGWRVVWW